MGIRQNKIYLTHNKPFTNTIQPNIIRDIPKIIVIKTALKGDMSSTAILNNSLSPVDANSSAQTFNVNIHCYDNLSFVVIIINNHTCWFHLSIRHQDSRSSLNLAKVYWVSR